MRDTDLISPIPAYITLGILLFIFIIWMINKRNENDDYWQ